jgi:acetoin utilization deacetylase AcuC-like enzyme/GNAT superfamily N-acetyltransferase
MFRIRQVPDDTTPANRIAIEQVQDILRAQFPLLDPKHVTSIPDQLRNPLRFRFRAVLLVAEDATDRVRGLALLLHDARLSFCFLEFLSAAPGTTSRGIGGALYQRVQEQARQLDTVGIFFECLPDDPALSPDPEIRRRNADRLRFYEAYGAYPIAGTGYETPMKPGATDPPYLVYDSLGRAEPLSREQGRRIVRAILLREYGAFAPPGYIDGVVRSFRDDPVRLRPARYARRPTLARPLPVLASIALVVSEGHAIHHVRERGYLESPVRIEAILRELEASGLFIRVPARHFPARMLRDVHDPGFVEYLRRTSALVPEGRSIYPYVFPIRNRTRPPVDLPLRAGYYCIDTFTPISAGAVRAALDAVDCTLTAAAELQAGRHLAYALVRPPGHHAERASFGGFCYFNSAAAAAHSLSRFGRVAVLDVDYHHGNGTQQIFYERPDVLTVSLHGPPRLTYPYFSGFEDERGAAAGIGANLNLPLPENTEGQGYRVALVAGLKRIRRFDPRYLVVSLGLDTARGDPTGSFRLGQKDFRENGRLIGSLGLPCLVAQEGGYRTRSLGANARSFFEGLVQGVREARTTAKRRATAPAR